MHHHQDHEAEYSAQHQADEQHHDAVYPAGEQAAGKVPNDAHQREDDEQTTNESELDPIRFRVCRFNSHCR